MGEGDVVRRQDPGVVAARRTAWLNWRRRRWLDGCVDAFDRSFPKPERDARDRQNDGRAADHEFSGNRFPRRCHPLGPYHPVGLVATARDPCLRDLICPCTAPF